MEPDAVIEPAVLEDVGLEIRHGQAVHAPGAFQGIFAPVIGRRRKHQHRFVRVRDVQDALRAFGPSARNPGAQAGRKALAHILAGFMMRPVDLPMQQKPVRTIGFAHGILGPGHGDIRRDASRLVRAQADHEHIGHEIGPHFAAIMHAAALEGGGGHARAQIQRTPVGGFRG